MIRVLHVDDDGVEQTADRLDRVDDRLTVCSETDPRTALERIRAERVDCVISGYRVRGTGGLELLERAREIQPDLPFVFYTSRKPADVISDVLSADATEYVRKSTGEYEDALLARRVINSVDKSCTGRTREDARLEGLIRAVQSDLVDATTREEIDTTVCDALADFERYAGVCIGEYEEGDGRIIPRAAAGAEPDGHTSVTVSLVHGGTQHGVLTVSTDRTETFTSEERESLEHLGETVAHAHDRIRMRERYEGQYRQLFQDAPVMIAFTREKDGEPLIEDCNQRFADKLGYTVAELRDRPLAELYTEESARRLLGGGGYERSLEGEFTPKEREFLTADGERLSTLLQASPRLDDEGEIVGTHALYVDVTDQKRAREVLERVEAMEASMDGMSILDENKEFVYVNQAHAEIYGYDCPEPLLGNTWRQLYEDAEIEQFEEEVFPALEDDGEWRGEATGLRAEGTTFPQELSLTRLEDGSMVCSVRDITARKERERTLRASKQSYQDLFENIHDMAFVHDYDGDILSVNQAACETLGYARKVLEDLHMAEIHPDDFPVPDEWGNVDALPEILEAELETKDGQRLTVAATLTEIEFFGREAVLGVARDVTERKEREREIRELTERLELSVEGANLGIWDWDMTTDEVEFNEQWADMLGYTLEELEPRLGAWERRVHPDDLEDVEAALEEHIAGETAYYESEHRMRTADGDWKWIRDIGKVVEREDGEPIRAVGVHLDIDDRKTYQRALEDERDMFTQGAAVVFKWEEAEKWPVEYVSENVTDVVGYTPEELEAGDISFADIVHEADRERVTEEVAANSDEGTDRFSHDPYRIVTAGGEIRWVIDHTKNVRQDGEVTHRLGYLIDITEQREKEAYLAKSQEVGNIGWWRKKIPSDQIIWSDRVYEMWGVEGESGGIDHDTFLEFLHPDDRADVDEQWAGALEGEPYDVEHRIVTLGGEVRWMRQKADLSFDENGEPVSAVGIVQDITEQKVRERELQQFRKAVEETAHAVYITDRDGLIEYANPAVTEITGYGEADLLGERPSLFNSGEHDETYYETLWNTVLSGDKWQEEIINERKDGDRIVLDQTITPITGPDGDISNFVAVARDVTERKRREESLESAHDELRKVVDLVPDLVFVKNRDGEYVLANEATADAYGLSPTDVEGKTDLELLPSEQQAREFHEDDLEVIDSGEPKRIPEEELTTADGQIRLLQTTKIPYEVTETGEDAVLGYARDVTDLKAYERRLEGQRDDLEVLNQVVRHDIRNDLQLVLAYTETLEAHVEESGKEYVRQVLEAAQEAVDITQTARDVTEILLQSQTDRSPTRLRDALELPIKAVRSSNQHAVITVNGPIRGVEVMADDMLESVFRNLLKNAILHNDKEVPQVTVGTHVTNETVRVRIADNGPGIPDDRRTQVFEQGETSLESEGTGLGLYLVQTLVDRYEGNTWIEENEPEGSVFVVELPIAR